MMKTLSKILVVLLVPISMSTQFTSNIGGGYEESLKEPFAEPLTEKDYDYSEIPADSIYGKWDTKNIHAYSFNRWQMKDTLTLVMRYDSCDFTMPHDGHITSVFGNRSGGYHHGIDVRLKKGENVKSAFEGMVRISQYSSSYGHVVVIRHNNGLETLYAHLSKRLVIPGEHVEAGDIIGLGGNTGRSTGSHLHFECRYKGEPVNPSKIIDFKNNQLKYDTIYLCKNNFKSTKNLSVKRATTVKLQSDSDKKKVQEKKVEKKVVVKEKSSANSEKTKGKSVGSDKSVKYHRVKSGNTIYSLARDNGVSVDQIRAWNGIGKNNVIKVGSKIRVQ